MKKARPEGRPAPGDLPPGWDRVLAIFDHPKPPAHVWESQFDYCDDELRRLARTPHREIDFGDLWYYIHDLSYQELQPELFDYLFPACLVDWHESLMRSEYCGHGDADFHYSLLHGRILERMLTPERRAEVLAFFRDSFLERIDAERGFVYSGSKTPAYEWVRRFGTLGCLVDIQPFWEPWWGVETPGRAVAVLQFCSGLMYTEGENPLFGRWTPEFGGGGPHLAEHGLSCGDTPWRPENVAFLARTLDAEYVADRVRAAVARLDDEPEGERARAVEGDLSKCERTLQRRAALLPKRLAEPWRDDRTWDQPDRTAC